MISHELVVCPKNMKVEIELSTVPRVVLISGGKAKEVELPHHGELTIKVAQGRIQKYEKVEGELF